MHWVKSEIRKPFGDHDCQVELTRLNYSDLYFNETAFNDIAVMPQTYLIIGRRGSGKTALAESFSFHKNFQNAIYIKIATEETYQEVLSNIASHTSETRQISIPRLKKVWEYIFWKIIFQHTRDYSTSSGTSDSNRQAAHNKKAVSHTMNSIINWLHNFLNDSGGRLIDERIDELLNQKELEAAKSEVLKIAKANPIIVAFDTLEKYDMDSDGLMNAMAGLIQCAADFNLRYSEEGIHLKIFVSGEIFPYLMESILQNPLKSVREPLYLFWRPKDLLRLICWRFHRCLAENNLLLDASKVPIKWSSPREVFNKMWRPYFGREITNARGFKENSFSYVLRHTQMRPRQLISLCNSIAKHAAEKGRFPIFSEHDIREGVRQSEKDLAFEIINSFSEIYPAVHQIVDALLEVPLVFDFRELDRRARESASKWTWQRREFSKEAFFQLVTELGIVGLVSRHNESGYIDADFEYSLQERLTVTHRAQFVIHPMFYSRFRVDFTNSTSLIMPFSTEREAEEDDDTFS